MYNLHYWKSLHTSPVENELITDEQEDALRSIYKGVKQFPLSLTPLFREEPSEKPLVINNFCWNQLAHMISSTRRTPKATLSPQKLYTMLPAPSSCLFDYYLFEKTTSLQLCKMICDQLWRHKDSSTPETKQLLLSKVHDIATVPYHFSAVSMFDYILTWSLSRTKFPGVDNTLFCALVKEILSFTFCDDLTTLYEKLRLYFFKAVCNTFNIFDTTDIINISRAITYLRGDYNAEPHLFCLEYERFRLLINRRGEDVCSKKKEIPTPAKLPEGLKIPEELKLPKLPALPGFPKTLSIPDPPAQYPLSASNYELLKEVQMLILR